MKDLMIDLETLGTDPDCVVLSLGAVFFDKEKLEIGDSFYTRFDFQDQISLGRTITAGTINWWMSRSDKARSVFCEKAIPTQEGLENFWGWLDSHGVDGLRPWGNGSIFDVSILQDLFSQFEFDCPWKYTNVRDLRTFRECHPDNVYPLENMHHALEDAKNQAQLVINI